MEIEELKKKFEYFKKYSLPPFDDLNREFDIGKIESYSGNLIRDIRRMMMEKIVHYIRLGELMLNPSQASPVFLVLLRDINSEDKKSIDNIFKNFVKLEIDSYKADSEYDEKTEAILIKEIYSIWNNTKPSIMNIVNLMERNWGNNQTKKEKGYFS